MLKGFKNKTIDFIDKQRKKAAIKHEIKKIKSPARVAIYKDVVFTAEQKAKIDKLYKENYGKKIPYEWHRNYTAYTGKFDEKYFPEVLYTVVFERAMTPKMEYSQTFSDKNILSVFTKGAGIKTPQEFITCSSGLLRDSSYKLIQIDEAVEILKDAGEVFLKPTVDSSSGRGCLLANFTNGIDQNTTKSVKEILLGMGENFTAQKKIKCDKSIAEIYGNSVNTFRVITYRWKDKIYSMPVIMRIGQGGAFLDNAHAGGMFIAVDDDGTLHETAFTEFKKTFTSHPTTNFVFKGHKISNFDKVLESAIYMHGLISQVGVVNWDFTIDEDGDPLLIEANMCTPRQTGSIWLVQMAHGKGAFGENTADILKWVSKVEKAPQSKRKKMAFGK